jgi:hypothetical protein
MSRQSVVNVAMSLYRLFLPGVRVLPDVVTATVTQQSAAGSNQPAH